MNIFANIAHAATDTKALDAILTKVSEYIVVPIIQVVFGAAVLIFLWGVVQFVMNAGDPGEREKGRNHIIWGVVGMAIMLSVYGIIRFVAATIGVNAPL